MFPDGTLLMKAKFVEITRRAIKDLGLPWEQFVGIESGLRQPQQLHRLDWRTR